MMRQLECEIVRDLLPSYADGQTSEVTNAAVEEHLASCPACAEILRLMREPVKPTPARPEEIDYLKKVKKSRRRTGWTAAVLTFLTALVLACLFIFVHGTETDLNMHAFQVSVDGPVVSVDGSLVSSGEGVARVVFDEHDGVVDIHLFTAPASPFSSGSFNETYTAKSGAVKTVTSGGLVLWDNGKAISRMAGRLYAAKNPYVGSMPANQKIVNILGIHERYGTYTNELQTSSEPYGWTLILEEPVDPLQETKKRQAMQSDACLMIAAVENLGSVTWKYDNGSGQQEYTFSESDATEYAGGDIKSFAQSASGMQELVETVR